jgi:hypothetical protein
MLRSKNITSFFAAERRASRLFNTHNLSVTFIFKPYEQEEKNNNSLILTSNELNIIDTKIKDKINELRKLEEELDVMSTEFSERLSIFKKRVDLCENKVVKPSVLLKIESLPSYKKTSGCPILEIDESKEDLILNDQPMKVNDCLRLMWATLVMAHNKDYSSLELILESVRNNSLYQYHLMIMSKTKTALLRYKQS